MLPLDAPEDANFLSEEAYRAALERLSVSPGSGIVAKDRLMRNLLSSQPTCFNLFGQSRYRPDLLTHWVRSIDPSCGEVESVEFEWAPPRNQTFGGGSAFDAAIFYTDGTHRCFLGVECKYSEDLAANDPQVLEVYKTYTEVSGHWREGASRRLDRPGLRQLWINTLLAQRTCELPEHDRGTHVVVACASDTAAEAAVGRIRLELHEPDRWLRWCPYEEVLETLGPSVGEAWAQGFLRRYCDFSPVEDLLEPDDPRIVRPAGSVDGLSELLAIGSRVTGEGSVLQQVVEALVNGRLSLDDLELGALNTRAAELAVDLKVFRQALGDPRTD
jgi:hypothetical protein